MKIKDLFAQLEELGIDPKTNEEEIGVEVVGGPRELEISKVEFYPIVNPHIRLVCVKP